ncbi:MAG: hypothetical protein ACK6D7_13845, partial [Acidobacteriota bacterium]
MLRANQARPSEVHDQRKEEQAYEPGRKHEAIDPFHFATLGGRAGKPTGFTGADWFTGKDNIR